MEKDNVKKRISAIYVMTYIADTENTPNNNILNNYLINHINYTQNYLPDCLKIECTKSYEKFHAEHILKGRKLNGKYKFITSMRHNEFDSNEIYYGDIKNDETEEKSFMQFIFSFKAKVLTIYFYHNWMPTDNKLRIAINKTVVLNEVRSLDILRDEFIKEW